MSDGWRRLRWRLSPHFALAAGSMTKVRKCFLDSPKIGHELLGSLESLPRVNDLTYPCAVTLRDGTVYPCALFVENDVYLKHYGGCYGNDKDPCISLKEVAEVHDSPQKMPLFVEKKMYEQGETHMGGYIVVLVLSDGTRYWHWSGDFLEFVSVPEGYRAEDVVDVVFPTHENYSPEGAKKFDDHPRCDAPDWKWVFFRL